jgi:hypothetical protein
MHNREAEKGEAQGKAPNTMQKNEGMKPEGKAATGGVESQTPREREKGETRMMTPQGKAPSTVQKNEGMKPEGKAAPDVQKKEGATGGTH